jgi:sec-independent protein translocase protein TatA
MFPLFGVFNLGGQEMVILLILGVLLFGKKLPEVGTYLGRGIRSFQNGFRGLEDELENATYSAPARQAVSAPHPPERVFTSGPKIETNGTGL